jgi:Putative translation initiation inhibitor, yjgF family
MADFVAVNEVYARHLSPPYPARSTIAVRALPKGGLVEIEMVALAADGESEQS